MPYLYTLAEQASRTGLPILRPLFLEFPDAAADRHPLDLDAAAASEFMVGSDLLIAPPPYGEELDSYAVEFPSADWFDYWTGEKVEMPRISTAANADPTAVPGQQALPTIRVTPQLAELPVFVHAGSILPMAPVVQSTNQTPTGSLTLRVYVGDHCAGDLYQDDGKTYAYLHGEYLRMNFSCKRTANGLRLDVSPHEGALAAWWQGISAEIFGWTPTSGELYVNGKRDPGSLKQQANGVSLAISDDGKGVKVELR
jgi:alpha-glucosidase